MKSKIISQEEFMSYMPHEDVLFFKIIDDRACLLSTFEITEDGLRFIHYGTSGWMYDIKGLEEFTKLSSITEVQSFHSGDMYIFEIPENSILPELRELFGENILFYRSFTGEVDFSFAEGLGLDEETVFACFYGTKIYSFPVYWQVYDRVEVEATSEEEAKSLLLANIHDIPLGYSPNYVDGSYMLDEDGPVLVNDSFSALYQHISFRTLSKDEEK